MNIRQALANWIAPERRVTDYNPAFAPDVWGRAIRPGLFASPTAVLSNLAVAVRCVSLRSDLLASVPLKVYRKLANGDKMRVSESPLARVLADIANPLMTAFELRELLVRSLDLHGNAFARIERDGAGQVVALWPIEAGRVTVERLESGRLRYRYSSDRGAVVLLQEEVLHIRASSEDGLLGRSPIAIARGALGLAVEQASTAASLAQNFFTPSGTIETPEKLGDRSREAMRAHLADAAREHAPRLIVLEHGGKWTPQSFSSEDAELLESRKLSNEDVARIFGVPPASVGISQSVSYGSAQQAAQDLVTNALAPLAARIEQAMQRCLLSTEARRTLIIEHDLSGLLRGDAATRWTTYRTGREIGALSTNEIRRFENLPGVEGGDEHEPLSLTPRAEPPVASAKP